MNERQGQLATVAAKLREDGKVKAHQMTYLYGITRTATYIHTLRHEYGWSITTEHGDEGQMSTYLLDEAPASWELPKRRRSRAVESWSCTTCGQTALDVKSLQRRTPTMARGTCGTCAAERLFRLA